LAVGELDPVVEHVVSDPVDKLVDASSAGLGEALLLFDVADARGNPVVSLTAIDFAYKPDLIAT